MSCKGQMTPRHNKNTLENKTLPSLVGKTIKVITLFFFFLAGRGGGREGLSHHVSGLVESECGIWILGSVENKEYGICGVKKQHENKLRYRYSSWKQLSALSTINPKKLAFSFPIPHSSLSTSIRSVENEASVIWKLTNILYFHYILIERVLYNIVASV